MEVVKKFDNGSVIITDGNNEWLMPCSPGKVVDLIDTAPNQVESLANNSESPNSSEWDGKGLPPVGCIVLGSFHYDKDTAKEWRIDYISESVGVYTVVESGEQYTFATRDVVLHKPETEAQKYERERMEAAIELHDTANLAYYDGCLPFNCGWDSAGDKVKNMWLAVVDKTGYRKGQA